MAKGERKRFHKFTASDEQDALRLAEAAAADARRARDAGAAALAATMWATDVGLALLRVGFGELGAVRKGTSYALAAAGAVNGAAYGALLGLWRSIGVACSEGDSFEDAMRRACEGAGVDADAMLGVMPPEDEDDYGFEEWFADLPDH